MARRNRLSGSQSAFEADGPDRAMLARLAKDARLPAVELGEDLDLSRTAIRRRMARLKEDGALGGAKIDHRFLGESVVEALVALDLTHNNPGFLSQTVLRNPAVISAIALLDNPDAILHVYGENLEAITETVGLLRMSGEVSSARIMPIVDKIPPQF